MEVSLVCPSCGEAVSLWIDPAGGHVQKYIEDCAVCCRPMSVRVAIDATGEPQVVAAALDE